MFVPDTDIHTKERVLMSVVIPGAKCYPTRMCVGLAHSYLARLLCGCQSWCGSAWTQGVVESPDVGGRNVGGDGNWA